MRVIPHAWLPGASEVMKHQGHLTGRCWLVRMTTTGYLWSNPLKQTLTTLQTCTHKSPSDFEQAEASSWKPHFSLEDPVLLGWSLPPPGLGLEGGGHIS